MIPLEYLPLWPGNDCGSVFVPNLGQIKMKEVDWDKWIPNVYQTVVWLGRSTPSYASQNWQKEKNGNKGSKKGAKNKGDSGTHGKGKFDKGKGGEADKGKGRSRGKGNGIKGGTGKGIKVGKGKGN